MHNENTDFGDTTEMHKEKTDSRVNTAKRTRKTFRVGVQQTPQQFLKIAKNLEHPMSPSKVIPEALKQAIFDNLTMDPIELAKSRLKAIVTIKEMALSLQVQEMDLKKNLTAEVSEVLATKRIALWEALLRASNFQDMEIVTLVKQGAELTGSTPPSPLFPYDWKPATTSAEELLQSSSWRREALQMQTDDQDQATSTALHEATMEEVKAGHLQGPFSKEELDEKFGEGSWLFTRRFALQQGTPENPKTRVIDDCKRSGLNSAYTTTNKLELLDVDVLACVMIAIARAHETGTIDLGESSEGLLSGPVHPAAMSLGWRGRTLDLSKAYKQVPIDRQSQQLCVLGYLHEGKWHYYTTNRLPFGATAAVYVFNRISRSIHHILCKFLHVVCTCFYDDFPALSHDLGAGLVTKAMSMVLNLLGWEHAQIGTKAVDFSEEFAALGVSIQLSALHRGSFVLANKEGRIPKIISMLERAKAQGSISKNEAAEIQGHLNFASGFFLSKSLRFLLGQFDAVSKMHGEYGSVRLAKLCDVAKSILLSLPPRSFTASSMVNPHLLFTDGAWEAKEATAGLLLHRADSAVTEVREITVPDQLVQAWLSEVGEQIICQIEFYAYLAARYEYRQEMENVSVIAWLDNEAARFAASKGSAVSPSLMAMARMVQALEVKRPSVVWVERVSSFSNPADKPSRKQCAEAAQEFEAMHVKSPINLPEEIVSAIQELTTDPYGVIKLEGLM